MELRFYAFFAILFGSVFFFQDKEAQFPSKK